MADGVLEQEPCYIYHVRSFQETSLILEVLSLNYGPLHVMARGAQRKKGGAGSFQPFVPLKLTMASGKKGDGFYFLRDYEICGTGYDFKMPDYFCGMYINELLHLLVKGSGPNLLLFASYSATLEAIAKRQQIEKMLRYFELRLLSSLGYGLSNWDDEGALLKPDAHYRFCLDLGFVELPASLLAYQQSGTAGAGAASQVAADAPDDSGLMFAKSKVRGPKMSSSVGPKFGARGDPLGVGRWWEAELRAGRGSESTYELAQKLDRNSHNFLGPLLTGSQITDIISCDFALKDALANAKSLTGSIIERLLHGREIESRRLYREYKDMLRARAAAKAAAAAPEGPADADAADAAEGKSPTA